MVVLHEVRQHNGCTSAHPSVTVHEYVGDLPVLLDELETFLEMLHYRKVFFIVSVDFFVEGNFLCGVGNG